MRGIAEQSHAWHAFPSVVNREGMDRAKHRIALAFRDEG
jgi:hypothetical protein